MSSLQPNTDKPIIVVTGLPLSGTSLMMQILQAGGVTLLTDEKRPPDVDNPRGYFDTKNPSGLPPTTPGWKRGEARPSK